MFFRVLVLDNGNIAEFAPPQELLRDTSSIFYGMCKNVGIKAVVGESSNGSGSQAEVPLVTEQEEDGGATGGDSDDV